VETVGKTAAGDKKLLVWDDFGHFWIRPDMVMTVKGFIHIAAG
jgi:hypothetical protein